MSKLLVFIALIALSCAVEQLQKNEGPAKIILDYLDDIIENVSDEQHEHDKLNTEQMAECDAEKTFRAQEVIDGEEALSAASAHLLRCEGSLTEAEADLSMVKQYLSEIESTLKELEARRQEQAQAFDNLVNNELNPAIEAVKGAFPIIDKFENSGAQSFAEVSRHMMYTFTKVSRAGKGGLMAGALSALAQVQAGQALDAGTVQKIRDLFNALLQDLKEAKQVAIETENKRIAIYKQTVAEYNTIKEGLQKQEKQLTQYIKEMQACIQQETGIIAAATDKVKNNAAALAYAIRMCDAFSKEYEEASKARHAELELLHKLKEFINREADIFGAYGVEHSNVFENYQKETGQKVDAKAIEAAIKAAQNQEVKTYLIQVRNMGLNRHSRVFKKLAFLQEEEQRETPKVSFVQGKLMRNL